MFVEGRLTDKGEENTITACLLVDGEAFEARSNVGRLREGERERWREGLCGLDSSDSLSLPVYYRSHLPRCLQDVLVLGGGRNSISSSSSSIRRSTADAKL